MYEFNDEIIDVKSIRKFLLKISYEEIINEFGSLKVRKTNFFS